MADKIDLMKDDGNGFVTIAEIAPIEIKEMTAAERDRFASDDDYWWCGERITKAEYERRRAA